MSTCVRDVDEETGFGVYECTHPAVACHPCAEAGEVTSDVHTTCDRLAERLAIGVRPRVCGRPICSKHTTRDPRRGDLCPEHAA